MTRLNDLTPAEEQFAIVEQSAADTLMGGIVEVHCGLANARDEEPNLENIREHMNAAIAGFGYMAACQALAGGLTPERADVVRSVVAQKLAGVATQLLAPPTKH